MFKAFLFAVCFIVSWGAIDHVLASEEQCSSGFIIVKTEAGDLMCLADSQGILFCRPLLSTLVICNPETKSCKEARGPY